MRWSLLVLCVCLGGSGMTLPDDPPVAPKTDMEKIQGTWVQTKRYLLNREMEPGEFDLTFDIRGDKLIMSQYDFPEQPIGEYKFSLDEKKKPKWFTWTIGKVTQRGIYEVKEDELKIIFNLTEKKLDQRPEDFVPRRGSDMYVLKRGKLPSKEKPDMKALLKEWKRTCAMYGKRSRPQELAAQYPLVILHSRHIYQRWGYEQSSFSFITKPRTQRFIGAMPSCSSITGPHRNQ